MDMRGCLGAIGFGSDPVQEGVRVVDHHVINPRIGEDPAQGWEFLAHHRGTGFKVVDLSPNAALFAC